MTIRPIDLDKVQARIDQDNQRGYISTRDEMHFDREHAVAILRELRRITIQEFGLDYQEAPHGNELAHAVLRLTGGGPS